MHLGRQIIFKVLVTSHCQLWGVGGCIVTLTLLHLG